MNHEHHLEEGVSMAMDAAITSHLLFLIVCLVVLIDMLIMLKRKEGMIQRLTKEHNRTIHSLIMSLGTLSSMGITTIVGTLMIGMTDMNYILQVLIGLGIGVSIALPFRDEAAMLDGVASGIMGGLMGVMIAYMAPAVGLYVIEVILTATFCMGWGVMKSRLH